MNQNFRPLFAMAMTATFLCACAHRDTAGAARHEPAENPVPLRIVDGQTGEPVADAEVRWIDLIGELPADVQYEEFLEAEAQFWNHDLALLEARTWNSRLLLRSDADGRVLLPASSHSPVLARKGNLIGVELFSDDEGGQKLPLWPDGDLSVRVLDAAGHGVADVPVVLIWDIAEWDAGFVEQRARTDAEGLAVMRHARVTIAAWTASCNGPKPTWRAAVEMIPTSAASETIDPSRGELAPVSLRMPPTGEVEFEVLDENARPMKLEAPMKLAELLAEPGSSDPALDPATSQSTHYGPDQLEATVENGRAIFRHVGLGRPLIAWAGRNAASRNDLVRLAGPTTAEQRVQVTLVMGRGAVVLSARVLAPDGTALANQWLLLMRSKRDTSLQGTGDEAPLEAIVECDSSRVRTDALGRIHVECDVGEQGLGRPLLTLARRRGTDNELEACIELEPVWSIGTHDLGDIRLQAPPVLAAGIVVDEIGRPLANATVDIAMNSQSRPRTTTNDRGEFTLRSTIPFAQVALRSRLDGLAELNQLGAAGQANWRLVMKAK